MSLRKNGSLTSAAYTSIRAEILACRLRPGDKLNIAELCETLGVSLGAVREALSRLTSEGLVISEPHRGFRAAPVSQEELEDLTRVRSTIEAMCLENAIAHGDRKWETGIVSTMFELSRIPLKDPADPVRVNEEWAEAHQRFHEALVASCDSIWLRRMREILYAQSERYRRISLPLDQSVRDVESEHKAIADAAIARDAARACAELRTHLERTTRILVAANIVSSQRDATAASA